MTAEPLPAWAIPPRGGFTPDDLDRIPGLPPHTGSIDGSRVFVSRQKSFHPLVIDLLVPALRATAPTGRGTRRPTPCRSSRSSLPTPRSGTANAAAVRRGGLPARLAGREGRRPAPRRPRLRAGAGHRYLRRHRHPPRPSRGVRAVRGGHRPRRDRAAVAALPPRPAHRSSRHRDAHCSAERSLGRAYGAMCSARSQSRSAARSKWPVRVRTSRRPRPGPVNTRRTRAR